MKSVITKDGMIVVMDNIMGNNTGLMEMPLESRNTTNKPNTTGEIRDIGMRAIK